MTFKALLATSALIMMASPSLAFAQTAAPSSPPRQGPFERADANKDNVITREEVRIARTEAFTRLDANRDGFLERTEMRAGHREGGPEGRGHGGKGEHGKGEHGKGEHGKDEKGMRPMGKPPHGDMMKEADTNRDGSVSLAEFNAIAARKQAQRSAEQETRRQAMFTRMDANRDGAISQAEANAMRTAMGEGRPPRVDPDTNKDKKISLAEWLARPDPLFERGDANKDGQVTREEAASIVREGRGHKGRPGRGW